MQYEDFAKLYSTESGQILVKLDKSQDDEDTFEVRFYCNPDGVNVCSVAYEYTSNDAFEKAAICFDRVTEEVALAMFKVLSDSIKGAGDYYSDKA